MTDKPEEMISIAAKSSEIPFATTSLDAPSFFVEDIRGAMISEGMAKLNLIEYRMNAITQELRAVHVATVILPAHKVGSWGRFLVKLAEDNGEMQAEETNAAP
jgi:hypothetical protein